MQKMITMSSVFFTLIGYLCLVHGQHNGAPLEPFPQVDGDRIPLAQYPDQPPPYYSNKLSMQYQTETGVCSSINIYQDFQDFQKIHNCRVIEGYLHIVNIEANETDYENLVFPMLSEITDDFVVVSVSGIKSLGRMFPNLAVIRGNNQFIKGYSFVVKDNPDLEQLGLDKLMHIGRGAVRIESNTKLCFAEKIDWSLIAPYTSMPFHFLPNNKYMHDCPNCPEVDVYGRYTVKAFQGPYSFYTDGRRLCWNETASQNICPTACKIHGCDSKGECCHSTCLGGCSQINSPEHCTACTQMNYNGVCVEKCPPNFLEFMGRRCISSNDCHQLKRPLYVFNTNTKLHPHPYFSFEGRCIAECPANHSRENNQQHPCRSHHGSNTIRSCEGVIANTTQDLQKLHHCTHIRGSVEIFIENDVSQNVLDQNLNSIQEIDGHLSLIGTQAFRSLSPFRNLRVIHGNVLYNDRYAFFAMYNRNLTGLASRPIEVKRGELFFYRNPDLCDTVIRKMQQQVLNVSSSCCDSVIAENDNYC